MIIGLLSTPIITRIVSPEEYGQLSIFVMYGSIAVMVLCMGLDQALVRYYYEEDALEYKQALLKRCLLFPVLVSIVLMIIVIALSALGVIDSKFDMFITVMLCIYVLTQIIYRFSQMIVRLEKKAKLYSALQILQKLSYFSIVLILCFSIKKHYIYILVAGTVISFIICMVVSILAQSDVWKKTSLSSQYKKNISVKELLTYSAPFIISMGITTLFQSIDKISLDKYCTYYEVGIYASTMTLVNIFAIVQTAFNTLWAPTAVEHYAKFPEDKEFHRRANQTITVIMFFLGISLILVKDIFAVLLGEEYRQAAYILPFLIFNPIMYTISETTVVGLVFKKKSNLQVVVALAACITNVIGNELLVPRLGCQGAAISTGISFQKESARL